MLRRNGLRLLYGLVALSSSALVGCAGSATPLLRVATDATYPPMEFIQGGQLVGFEIDLMTAVAERAGFRVTFVNLPWDSLFDELTAGRVDALIASITITPERRERFAVSQPYLDGGQVIVVPTASVVTGPGDLAGRRVGALAETTSAAAVTALAGAELVPFATLAPLVEALLDGTIDALVTDSPVAADLALNARPGQVKIVGEPLTDEQFGILLRLGDERLAALDAGLAAVQAAGLDRELMTRWGLPTPD